MISNVTAFSQNTKNVSFGAKKRKSEETVTISKSKYLLMTAALAALTAGGCTHTNNTNNRPWQCTDSFERSALTDNGPYTVELTREGYPVVVDKYGDDIDDLSLVPAHIRRQVKSIEENL